MKPGQLIKYVRPDGTEIYLHSPPSRAVANMTGWGYPATNIHTISGPFQHGESILGYRFQPRAISMDVIKKGCSRSEWFNERTRLIDRLGLQTTNPNLPQLGTLHWEYVQEQELKQRAIDCYLSRGLGYSPDPQWWQYGILESLEFIAPDPIIYDPNLVTVTINSFEEELELPMVFPFLLGAEYISQDITYTGSWYSYPIIEIDGPTAGIYIENTSIGKNIRLDYVISSGITVTINLSPGAKTITDSDGNNLIQYLSIDSNLSQFVLERDPIVPGGINTIYIVVTDADANTEVRFKYYTQYVGI